MCMPTRGASALYVCLHAERVPYMYALCVSLHVYDTQVELMRGDEHYRKLDAIYQQVRLACVWRMFA